MSKLEVIRTEYDAIQTIRSQFLQSVNCQIRYDSCHYRHWADEYHLILDGQKVGYGSVKGLKELAHRDAIFEFFVLPPFQKYSPPFFQQLIEISHATYIECQSNDFHLSPLLYEFGHQIYANTILFADHITTQYFNKQLSFRKRQHGDNMFGKATTDEGEFVLVYAGEIVADGGFLLHYNKPFADLYMETAKAHRKKGYASYILQELKKACYQAGRVPAARCHIQNKASKAALTKAGMQICGYMLIGRINRKS